MLLFQLSDLDEASALSGLPVPPEERLFEFYVEQLPEALPAHDDRQEPLLLIHHHCLLHQLLLLGLVHPFAMALAVYSLLGL